MRYAGIIKNDVVNGEGVCVSLFVQGCPHRCKGCFNPETWSFKEGIEKDTSDLICEIRDAIVKNGIQRNLSILGGEPLCPENIYDVIAIVTAIRKIYPNIKISIWTGYTIEELLKQNENTKDILKKIDYLIEGPYIEEKRDITLKWRGSKNQRILTKENIYDIINHKGE